MKTNRTVLVIVEISLLTSLALIFDWVANFTQIRIFPNGGSISLSMLPILVLAFRRGLVPALVSGLLLGTLQTILGVTYYLYFIQFLLDYTIGFGLVGFAGIFYKIVQNKNLKIQYIGIVAGAILGGLLRYMSHVLAGVVYWSRIVEDTNIVDFRAPISTGAWSYSFIYNATYMIPSIIICTIVLILMNRVARKIFTITE